jgi:hypothetical protein
MYRKDVEAVKTKGWSVAGHECYESTTRLARLEHLRISGVRVFAS